MLQAVGVNVPRGRSVVSREDAWQAAQEVGLPVVVKPRNSNHSIGVSLDLSEQAAVLAAYDWACEVAQTTNVLVEQYIRGDQPGITWLRRCPGGSNATAGLSCRHRWRRCKDD